MKNVWVAEKCYPMCPKIWLLWEVKRAESNAKAKVKTESKDPKLRTMTFSSVSDASTFTALWWRFAPIWPHTRNVPILHGCAMSVRKPLEPNGPYVSTLCKFIKPNLFATNAPKTLVPITKSSFAICKEHTSPRKRKKTVCTNAQNVQDLSITRRIWNAIWPNTRKVLSRRVTISKKRSSFATNAEKSTEITNHGSTTSRVTALYINAKLVPVVSKHLVVSNTTWLCILVLLLSIAASAEKPLSPATSCCSIKSPGIQTKDHMRANGVEKVSYSPTNWQSIVAESTLAKNLSNATCATRGSPIQVHCRIIENVTLESFIRPLASLHSRRSLRPMANKPSLLQPEETRMSMMSIQRTRPQQQLQH